MNYQANHIIISMGFTAVAMWVIGYSIWWFVLPILFYTLREVYQYVVLKRTKRFDWAGCVPVIISQLLLGAILWN